MTKPIGIVEMNIRHKSPPVRISSKADYAVRAALELAAAAGEPLSAETISQRQGIPAPFLKKILSDLQRGNVVMSQRGRDGGHRLARSANEITIADVLRAVEGPLANVRGRPPEETVYEGRRPGSRTSGSRCARTCARSSNRSRSPISPRTACRRRSPRSRAVRTPGSPAERAAGVDV